MNCKTWPSTGTGTPVLSYRSGLITGITDYRIITGIFAIYTIVCVCASPSLPVLQSICYSLRKPNIFCCVSFSFSFICFIDNWNCASSKVSVAFSWSSFCLILLKFGDINNFNAFGVWVAVDVPLLLLSSVASDKELISSSFFNSAAKIDLSSLGSSTAIGVNFALVVVRHNSIRRNRSIGITGRCCGDRRGGPMFQSSRSKIPSTTGTSTVHVADRETARGNCCCF
jgi:hypothetical protein